jgi:hypothetical protein
MSSKKQEWLKHFERMRRGELEQKQAAEFCGLALAVNKDSNETPRAPSGARDHFFGDPGAVHFAALHVRPWLMCPSDPTGSEIMNSSKFR